MKTQINETENLLIFNNFRKKFIAIDGEELVVEFLKFNQVREDISDAEIGEFVGMIDVLYPVAGLKVTLKLEVFQGIAVQFNNKSGVFKLPFVDNLVSIMEIEDELLYLNFLI